MNHRSISTTLLAMSLAACVWVAGCGGTNESSPAPTSGALPAASESPAIGGYMEADDHVSLSLSDESNSVTNDGLSAAQGMGGGGFGGNDPARRSEASSAQEQGKPIADAQPFFDDSVAQVTDSAKAEVVSGSQSSSPSANWAFRSRSSGGRQINEFESELAEKTNMQQDRPAPATALGIDPGASPTAADVPSEPMDRSVVRRPALGRFGRVDLPELNPRQQRAPQFDLQPGEELWVIAKAANSRERISDSDAPGSGCLMATLPNETEQVPVPLKHTAVEGNIDGYIATVDVTQQFHNPYDSKIEAVYVFPLPQNAAVNEFVMTVGERKIRGIIREREKAEQIYAAAKAQGHVAALMTQERPNIFTQKVANIEPGKQIDINIRYFNTLQYDDGAYEFVFPMVVGPRYNPPATSDGIGAVPRSKHDSSGQKTEVQYLAPGERSGHDVSLSLNISAGVDIEDVQSVNHAVNVKDVCESRRSITLAAGDSIPNKDFVLRYKVAGDQIKTAMLTHEDEHGRYFTMMLYPPADLSKVQRSPMEMVFVLDCSGSMSGQPIAQAKAAVRHALQSLTPRDTFQIIRFSNNASQLGTEPVLATEDNIKRGLKYLDSLNGSGGTQMIEGIKAALDFPHDEGRFRLVSFMTDGYIGNEQQILSTLHEKLGASRVFSFGVGQSPNRFLMDRMAILGRGAVTYLSLNDDAVAIMDRFNRRISHPAMTDLSIDWGSMKVADVYPQRLPDLIVGRPVVITGRFEGQPDVVKVNGRIDMEPQSFAVALDEENAVAQHKGIAAVWARLKIKDLMNYATQAPEAVETVQAAVTETALSYNLMSAYTSFVAVDSLSRTAGESGTTVPVAVPVPEGVKYETTVGANP
ncbi:MAG: VWA domain-containing protein [Planctomycetaceae bacterium]|nr:VWA domain-containing protein [Planctomycetaceae bacterium]